jgi:hypothetical protein
MRGCVLYNRVFGTPFTVSEYNDCFPGRCQDATRFRLRPRNSIGVFGVCPLEGKGLRGLFGLS